MIMLMVGIVVLLIGVHGWENSIYQELRKMNTNLEELIKTLKSN